MTESALLCVYFRINSYLAKEDYFIFYFNHSYNSSWLTQHLVVNNYHSVMNDLPLFVNQNV